MSKPEIETFPLLKYQGLAFGCNENIVQLTVFPVPSTSNHKDRFKTKIRSLGANQYCTLHTGGEGETRRGVRPLLALRRLNTRGKSLQGLVTFP